VDVGEWSVFVETDKRLYSYTIYIMYRNNERKNAGTKTNLEPYLAFVTKIEEETKKLQLNARPFFL
jgi:hypothetical protein